MKDDVLCAICDQSSRDVNNQFLMEDQSDSDNDSIESITSKSLSNISKRKFVNFDVGFANFEENATKEGSQNVKFTDPSRPSHKDPSRPLHSSVGEKSLIDREFKQNKDLLFNLSNSAISRNRPGLMYTQMHAIRNTIINYQIKHNIFVKSYDFIMLLSTILLLSGKALHCVVQINIALLPLYEIVIHVIRYIIDQLAMISETTCRQEKVKVSVMFFLQTMTLILVTLFIYGSVLIPLFYIGMTIFWKIGYFLLV
ncbi:hypothetical protein M8J76_002650 [Diaphorina citri]|nr:hypothetical protein M8J75_012096 [Diaphorina citri]KAI5713640.1 hypothetical protein M8J76_002650 [Diaphorina citri]KAI5716017.1 hypothetical protein M8J77_026191 [Diaphorina citri]